MNTTRISTLLALTLSFLGGCANLQPVVAPTAPPDPASGYVAGSFTKNDRSGFAFILTNTETGAEFSLPLGEGEVTAGGQVVAMKVPPGRYAVTHWLAYAWLTKEVLGKKNAVVNPYLRAPFTVKAGAVTYLGNYNVTSTNTTAGTMIYYNRSIRPQPVSSSDARSTFLKTYPGYSAHVFDCTICLDTLSKLPVAPAAAASAASGAGK